MIIDKENTQEIQKFYMLMKNIQLDAESGLGQFYNEYGKFVAQIAAAFQTPTTSASEIFQEVLIKVWRAAKKPKIISSPKGWIYTVTANSAKSLMRKRPQYPLNENIVAANDETEKFIEKESFNYLIRALTMKEREVIVQKLILGETFEEIAKKMKRPIGTVSSTYYRALDKVKMDLEKNFLKI